MAEQLRVSVEGLSQFGRSLRKLDADLPKGLRIALNGTADALIGWTRPKIPSRTGAARASLKAKSTRTAVRIGVGGRRAPYYPWLDFGGATGIRRSVQRRFYSEGRYLYPTLAEHRPDFTRILESALTGVAERAGLDVT